MRPTYDLLLQTYFYIKHNEPVTSAQIREVARCKTTSIEGVLHALESMNLLLWQEDIQDGGRIRRTFGVLR